MLPKLLVEAHGLLEVAPQGSELCSVESRAKSPPPAFPRDSAAFSYGTVDCSF
jgi:hypothetical protein